MIRDFPSILAWATVQYCRWRIPHSFFHISIRVHNEISNFKVVNRVPSGGDYSSRPRLRPHSGSSSLPTGSTKLHISSAPRLFIAPRYTLLRSPASHPTHPSTRGLPIKITESGLPSTIIAAAIQNETAKTAMVVAANTQAIFQIGIGPCDTETNTSYKR